MSTFGNNFSILSWILIILHSFHGEAINIQTKCKNGHNQVFSVDNLLNPNEIEWLNGYLRWNSPWVLNQKDIFKESFIDLKTNATWVSPISAELLERTRLWREMSNILKQLSGGNEQYLCYAMFTLAYRLDFKPVSRDDSGLMAHIFLNADMKKNDYGETVFYDDNNEIMCGIYQRPGRVLIWNSTISYMSKPPSMLYVQSLNSIVLKFTNSLEEYKNCMEFSKANKQAILHSKPQNFPFTTENNKLDCLKNGNINYAQHLKNKYFDSKGHEIAVFDNVLSQSDLQKLREYFVNDYHTFGFQPYDNERSEDHDNVAWISVQKSDVLVQSSLWEVIKQAATFLSGLDTWYPYDVSMNIIHSFHHTRIHEDCEPYEHEYTFLLYLNPKWNEDLYGETVFFEQVNLDTHVERGDEEYDIIAAVRPRYGRIVIFRGIIPHSARPPSPGFLGARYTFACKVSNTFGNAKSKKLQETVDALQEFGLNEDEIEFSEEFENYKGKTPDNVVNSELIRQKQRLDNLVQERQANFMRKLSEPT